jgi:hypothetical protein
MINAARVYEIQTEIRKIEDEQEEAEICIKKQIHECKDLHESIKICLSMASVELEACRGDSQIANLVEEKHSLLLAALNDCDGVITCFEEEQRYMKNKCETDIEELEREQQLLEVMSI